MLTILDALEHVPFPTNEEGRQAMKFAANLAHYLRTRGTPVWIHRHQSQVPKEVLEKFMAKFDLSVTWTFDRVFYDIDKQKEPKVTRGTNIMVLDNRIIVVPSESGHSDDGEVNRWDYWMAFCGEDATPEMVTYMSELVAEALRNSVQPDIDRIGILQDSKGGLELGVLKMPAIKFQPENYSAEVSEWWQYLNDSIEKDKKMKGKLSILQGPPGCGKTMFLRSMLYHFRQDPRSKFIYVPLHVAKNLSSPTFVPLLNAWSHRKLILVVEDADMLLAKRKVDNGALISEFLNLTDGIVGAALNLHLICTTNLPQVEFDPAITRPGRLHSLLKFEELPKDKAALIYKRECGRELVTDKDKLTLAEVYSLATEEDTGHTDKVFIKTGQYL